MKSNKILAIAMALLAGAGGAAAQGIYRCGSSYSQQPCAGSTTVAPAQEAPSAAQQAQSQANTRRDAKLAHEMEKERLKDEAKPVSAYIPAAKTEPPADKAQSQVKSQGKGKDTGKAGKGKKPEHFTAVVPGSNVKKKKKES
ncbi:MAG TPA: hypothetical protein VLJ58_10120 [Ramlibacter sp.]|nr:hypothetical protein [Ramlibacter sp.]